MQAYGSEVRSNLYLLQFGSNLMKSILDMNHIFYKDIQNEIDQQSLRAKVTLSFNLLWSDSNLVKINLNHSGCDWSRPMKQTMRMRLVMRSRTSSIWSYSGQAQTSWQFIHDIKGPIYCNMAQYRENNMWSKMNMQHIIIILIKIGEGHLRSHVRLCVLFSSNFPFIMHQYSCSLLIGIHLKGIFC